MSTLGARTIAQISPDKHIQCSGKGKLEEEEEKEKEKDGDSDDDNVVSQSVS
jgi:hypothetical protein